MMTKMLERAARAVDDETYGELTELRCAAIARAVLMAVRESSAAVADVGLDAIDPLTPSCLTRLDEAQDFWGAMIDAILSEAP